MVFFLFRWHLYTTVSVQGKSVLDYVVVDQGLVSFVHSFSILSCSHSSHFPTQLILGSAEKVIPLHSVIKFFWSDHKHERYMHKLDKFIAGKEFRFEPILKAISIASTKLTMCQSVQQLCKHRNKPLFGTKCNKLK